MLCPDIQQSGVSTILRLFKLLQGGPGVDKVVRGLLWGKAPRSDAVVAAEELSDASI